MGSLQASEFAQAVEDGRIQLEPALGWHLTSNHWPPLPVEYVEILSNVIRGINEGRITEDDFVALPTTLKVLPSRAELNNDEDAYVIPAGELIDITHCWHWIDQ